MAGRAVRVWATAVVVACATLGVAADTLYLRDGSRVEGELVRVENGRVEFREAGGRNSQTLRFDLDEIRRIDFDDRGGGNWGGPGGDRGGSGGDRGGNRPQGLREREIVVSADVPWNDAGIEVRAGQTVYFYARGRARWGKDRQDGPAGENNSPYNANRPLPNRAGGALIGSIGRDSGDIFFIGDDSGAFRIRSAGRLYLGINDDVLDDNSGNFRVTVYY